MFPAPVVDLVHNSLALGQVVFVLAAAIDYTFYCKQKRKKKKSGKNC